MFKNSSFEDELYKSMEKTLVNSQVEDTHQFNRIAKAADLLNNAAELFEKAGMHQEASEVTEVLQELVKKLSGKTSSL